MQQTIKLQPGTVGTYSGFRAVIIRHYYENLYEVRVPGGVVCIGASEFIIGE